MLVGLPPPTAALRPLPCSYFQSQILLFTSCGRPWHPHFHE